MEPHPLSPPSPAPPPLAGVALPLLGAAAGLGWFLVVVGLGPLEPSHIEWLLQGDWAPYLLGWTFFRDAPSSLPLGQIPGLGHPVGTSLAYTDAIPWVALALKPFSGLLPFEFQYHGPWLASCFALQGFFGTLIAARLSSRRLFQLAGGLLFTLTPLLPARVGHLSLCAHWLILGVIWLHLRPSNSPLEVRRTLLLLGVLTVIAGGVHPYLLMMVLALGMALVARLAWVDHSLRVPWALGFGALLPLVAGGTLLLFGYIGGGPTLPAGGFSGYSADLLAFINPQGMSRLLPTLPMRPTQYEGFGYLGTGALAVALGAVALVGFRRTDLEAPAAPRLRFLAIACGVLGVVALGSEVTVAGSRIVGLKTFYSYAPWFTETFRSPGRFIWPLNYLVLTASLVVLARPRGARGVVGTGVLCAAVLLQWGDLNVDGSRARFQSPHAAAELTPWEPARGEYRHLALVPPTLVDGAGRGCAGAAFSPDEAARLGLLAYRLGMTFNSVYAARLHHARAEAYCERLQARLGTGELEPDTLYVVHREHQDRVRSTAAHPLACGSVGPWFACVRSGTGRFARLLEARLHDAQATETAPAGP
jgi:hypothetical protein